MRHVTALVTLALVAATSAALTETEDFPDTCEGYGQAEIGEPVSGTLDVEDDTDFVGLNATEDDVGENVTVDLSSDEIDHLDLTVFEPDCEGGLGGAGLHKGKAKTGKGHFICHGAGHDGECVADDGSVTFTPGEPGIYVLRIRLDPASFEHDNGGGNDPGCEVECSCIDCFDAGPSSTPSSSGKGGGRNDGPTIESCHFSCASRSFEYVVETDSTGDTPVVT